VSRSLDHAAGVAAKLPRSARGISSESFYIRVASVRDFNHRSIRASADKVFRLGHDPIRASADTLLHRSSRRIDECVALRSVASLRLVHSRARFLVRCERIVALLGR